MKIWFIIQLKQHLKTWLFRVPGTECISFGENWVRQWRCGGFGNSQLKKQQSLADHLEFDWLIFFVFGNFSLISTNDHLVRWFRGRSWKQKQKQRVDVRHGYVSHKVTRPRGYQSQMKLRIVLILLMEEILHLLIWVNLPLFTGVFTCQVVVWDFFHQLYHPANVPYRIKIIDPARWQMRILFAATLRMGLKVPNWPQWRQTHP